jgi:pimeloyl-ACP methyl ester carboxylesterase
MLLLHGLSSNVPIWDAVGVTLARDFRVAALDQRNHGLSEDADDFSFDAMSADVAAVVGALDAEPAIVIGHSWGASVALNYAASNASRAVVCVDGGMMSLGRMRWEDAYSRLMPPEIEGPRDAVMRMLRDAQAMLPWERLDPVMSLAFTAGSDGVMRRRLPIDKHMRIVRALWEQDVTALYARVSCPVMLVLAGGLESGEAGFVSAKREAAARLADEYPALRIEWLPSEHDIPLLHPREVGDLIGDFARSL